MANTIKLEVNVPVTGVIRQVWYQKSTKAEWSDQIKIKGVWDGKGEGNIYVHNALEAQMQQKGIINARNGDSYAVIGSPRVQLLKKEDGTKKFVEVSLLSGGGASASASASASSGGNAAGQTRNVGDPKVYWQKLQLTMASCIKTARKIGEAEYGNNVAVSQDAIALYSVALFNERVHAGLLSTPPAQLADQATKDQIANGCVKLNQDENWLKAELLKVGCSDIAKLTAPEAAKVMEAINSAIAAKEAAAASTHTQSTMYESACIPF